jgi:hypothetical protein
MPVLGAEEKIINTVSRWGAITYQPHRFGGVEFKLGKREIAHVHGNFLVDIPFTKKMKNEIVSAGLADAHHILPESGWISKYLKTPRDVDTAIELLRVSFELALEQRNRRTIKN